MHEGPGIACCVHALDEFKPKKYVIKYLLTQSLAGADEPDAFDTATAATPPWPAIQQQHVILVRLRPAILPF